MSSIAKIIDNMKISVLGIQPQHFLRKKNTDWRHSFLLEKAFSESPDGGVSFELRRSIPAWLSMNARHLRGPISRYLKFVDARRDQFVPLFDADEVSRFDVIYSYDCFPRNSTKPVVWHNGPTDTELLSRRGMSYERIREELDSKAWCAQKSCLIAVSSENAKIEFDRQFPGFHKKTIVLPFVLPGVVAVTEEEVIAKHAADSGISILFVGRQARLKGLDLVIAAFERLRASRSAPVSLTIVSDLSDGAINIPHTNDVTWHKELSHAAVQELMRKAHILIMPSREESYGLVYVEAMASGAVPIAPAREPQISLLGNGSAGVLCNVSMDGVLSALEQLVDDKEARQAMALNGLFKYRNKFSLNGVLRCYEQAFRSAAAPLRFE